MQEGQARAPQNEGLERVWTQRPGSPAYKEEGESELGACPRSLVTPEATWRWQALISPQNNGYVGVARCAGLPACCRYQLRAS